MKTAYTFNYCYPIKNGDSIMPALTDFNDYELYNGGPNGDLWCASTSNGGFGWRPKQSTSFYDRTKKPGNCP